MAIDALQLLNQLASAGRIGGLGHASGTPTTGVDQASFADLLNQARDGSLSTKAPVTIRSGSEVSLSEDQIARLSLAADRAEASGIRNALVLLDGKRLLLDVRSREIIGNAAEENGVIAGVDGIMDLGTSATAAPGAQAPGGLASPPNGLVQNASLARLLQAINVD